MQMLSMSVYLLLTTCILLVQCFDVHHNKIFEEIKKENLRNSLGGEFSENNVEIHPRVTKKFLKIVKNGDYTENQRKTEGKTNFLNVDVPGYKEMDFHRNKSQTTFYNSAFNDTQTLRHIATSKLEASIENPKEFNVSKTGNWSNILTQASNIIIPKEIPANLQENSDIQKFNFLVGDYGNNGADNINILNLFGDVINLNFEAILGALIVTLENKNQTKISRSIADTMKDMVKPPKGLSPMLPYVLVPALGMAGMLPWILPGIRMAAGFVQMINQMAFMAGLFTLVRGYIFDHKPDEHVVYLNHGYHRHDHSQYSDHKKNS